MKKLFILFSLFALIGCSKKVEVEPITINSDDVTPISVDQFKSLLKTDEGFIFYVGSEFCGECIAFKPTLTRFVKETGQPIYYIDIDNAFENSSATKKFFSKYFKMSNPITPTIAYGHQQSVTNVHTGKLSFEQLKEMIKP